MNDDYDYDAIEAQESHWRLYSESQIRVGVAAAAAEYGWTDDQATAIEEELVDVARCYASENSLVSDVGLLGLMRDWTTRGVAPAPYSQMIRILEEQRDLH